MTSVTTSVTTARPADLDAFVASVTRLFEEDAGTHDPVMDVSWPVREGHDYYGGLLTDEAVLLAVARDGDRVVGHLVGKLVEPDSLRRQRLAVLESIRVDPDHRGHGTGGRRSSTSSTGPAPGRPPRPASAPSPPTPGRSTSTTATASAR